MRKLIGGMRKTFIGDNKTSVGGQK